MKVKELIKKLKKMPPDLEVGVSHHDNKDGEVAGWVCDASIEDEVDLGSYPSLTTGRKIVIIIT